MLGRSLDPRSSSRAQARATALWLIAFLVGCIAIVRPFGDFPLNDGWAFSWSVRVLVNQGILRLADWVSPSSVFHIGWGALWTWPFGFHHVALRFSVFFWVAVSGLGFAATLRRLGVEEARCRLAALCLVANPLVLVFGLTFHTDVTFLGLGVAAFYAFVRFREADDVRWLWLASLFVGCAILTRQTGVGFAFAMAAALAHWRVRDAHRWAAALVIPVVAAVGYLVWFETVHGPTWASANYVVGGTRAYLGDPARWLPGTFYRAFGSLPYAALFALPVLVAARPPRLSRWTGGVALGAAALALCFGWLPYFSNSLSATGIGNITVHSEAAKAAGIFGLPAFAAVLTGAAWAAAWWFATGLRWRSDPRHGDAPPVPFDAAGRRELAAFCALGWLGVFGVMFATGSFFDRYLMLLVPPALMLAAGLGVSGDLRRGWAAFAALAVLSTVGTADYFAWNEARWRLGRRAMEFGIEPRDIAGGVDWEAYWTYPHNMALLKSRKPLEQIGEWEWQHMNSRATLIAFSPGTRSYKKVLDVESYWTPLSPLRSRTLYLIGRDDAEPARAGGRKR